VLRSGVYGFMHTVTEESCGVFVLRFRAPSTVTHLYPPYDNDCLWAAWL
jgi:hypothetical protein